MAAGAAVGFVLCGGDEAMKYLYLVIGILLLGVGFVSALLWAMSRGQR